MKGKKLLLSLIGGALCTLGANAMNFSIGAFNYATNDDSDSSVTISVAGYLYGDVEIPATVDAYDENDQDKTYTVTAIDDEGFKGCSEVNSFTIPNTIIRIGEKAFAKCSAISTIDIPESVLTIGGFAFESCSSLTSVTVGAGITEIGDFAFDGVMLETFTCYATVPPTIGYDTFYWMNLNSLTVKVPEGSIDAYKTAQYWSDIKNFEPIAAEDVTEIEIDGIVYGDFSASEPYTCNVIATGSELGTDITILATISANGHEYAVKGINNNVFYSASVVNVTLSEGIESIGDNAFYCCSALKDISMPSTLNSIGFKAFYGCTGILHISIPGSVETIGGSAFMSCTKLYDITLCEGIKNIGEKTFEKCKGLYSITLPESLETIGKEAFNECKNLCGITIPDNVNTVGYGAFWACTSLTTATLSAGMTEIPGGMFAYGGIEAITIPDNIETIGAEAFTYTNLAELEIPDGVKTIGTDAFSDCLNLTTVTFGSGLNTIGENAFYECSALTDITWGENITEIGINAFAWCTAITEFELPNSVTTLKRYAFNGCTSLSSVNLGTGVTTIGESAFVNCDAITEVIVGATVPPTMSPNAFTANAYRNAELIVPEGSESAYKEAEGWSNFASIIPTGVEGVSALKSICTIVGGNLTFTADCGNVLVSDMQGRVLYSGAVVAGQSIALANNGVYAVKMGNKVSKIAL